MIKVVHLQTHLPSSGNAAKRLHNAFLEYGIDSRMLSLSTDIDQNERIKALGKKERIITWLRNRFKRTQNTAKHYGTFSFPIYGWNVSKNDQVKRADIIYLHWVVGGFLSFKSLRQLAKLNKPIIFFMHDMWTITGGCHYSFDCEKYKIGCGSCQMFSINKQDDLSTRGFAIKNGIFSKYKNLYFIAPSKWLFDCAKDSLLTKNRPVFHIPNVIDTKLFKPFDKQIAKRILNIDADSFVIAFGASSVTSPYKGWHYLQEALKIYKRRSDNEKITILIFGSDYDNDIAKDIPFDFKFLGQFRDDYSSLLVYNASNLFLAPSLADNLPTTVVESMCCGTPVVGFNIGGIPDIIKHKENGYLAKYKDAEDLANGIAFCRENDIKGFLLQDFDTTRIVKRHMQLFDSFNLNAH